jgi:predicted cobalt transporter CbtA
MRKHLRAGLIASLITFIILVTWAAVGMYIDPELPSSPIAFTAQRYWLAAWTIISLLLSLLIFTLTTIFLLLISQLKKYASDL